MAGVRQAWAVGSGLLCTGEPKCCESGVLQGALHLYHLGELAGSIANADQGFPDVYHAGAVSVGWLGLVWVRVLGPNAVAGWLGCPDLLLTMLSRWRGI